MESPRKPSLHEKQIAASVLLKLFINEYERCLLTDAPSAYISVQQILKEKPFLSDYLLDVNLYVKLDASYIILISMKNTW